METRPFIIPVFIPNLGCPHRCVFCDQRAVSGASVAKPSPESIQDRIRTYLGYKGSGRGKTEVAFYGGNFLGLSASYRNDLLTAVQPFVDGRDVDSIRFSTRPDSVSKASLDALDGFSVAVIELGAQSMDNRVLGESQRGHRAEETERAVAMLRARGIQVGVQLMPGLPGDTTDTMIASGQQVVRLAPDMVRIYPAVVIKGTTLERWYRDGRFTPLTLDDAVEVTKKLYGMFVKNDIPVIRMGLHGDESLRSPETIVAGPFHPAFGHLVYGALLLDRAIDLLESQGHLSSTVTLKVHPRHLSRLKGDRGRNVKILCERFALETLRIISDGSVPPGKVFLDSGTHGRTENLPFVDRR